MQVGMGLILLWHLFLALSQTMANTGQMMAIMIVICYVTIIIIMIIIVKNIR